MDEKEVIRQLELHTEHGKAPLVTRRPTAAGRRSVCLVVFAAATLLLFLSGGTSICGLYHNLQHPGTTTGFEAPHSSDRHRDDAPAADLYRNGTPVVLRRQSANATTTSTSATATATVLEDFEVHQPVLTPLGATLDDGGSTHDSSSVEDSCSVVLMDHVFAYSYGTPYVGEYTPPSCKFNRVVMNFTVVSEGRQYDRLALMYFGDTEIWRTSTAEPTTAPGIRWVYLKDMTEYLSLWKTPQKLIFDLGNLITDVYTGDYNTTLTATFFYEEVDVATAPPADLIIPISARKSSSDSASQFTLPAANATNTISFPQNVNRAVFSVSANGQANEEFWWSDVLQSDADAFDDTAGSFPGYSPWREVQVLIDGQLAGVQWPFPVVFTGGVVPSLHRPIVGPDAFDLKEHEIDITPWLPLLCDGNNHTFTIYVAGLLDNGGSDATVTQTVGSSWYVTGKIFVWLDDEGSVTTGTTPIVDAPYPGITVSQAITQNATGANETLTYDTEVSRSYKVSSKVVSQNASSHVSWTQDLSYSNKGYVWAYGYSQINDFLISGSDVASSSSPAVAGAHYKSQYEYPLWCNTSYGYSPQGNLSIYARLIQGKQVYVEGAAVFPDGLEAFSEGESTTLGPKYSGSLAKTSKDGTAYFFEYADDTHSIGYGSSDQVFSFGGFTGSGGSIDATPDQQLYYRHVTAVNSTVVYDDQELAGNNTESGHTGHGSGGSGYREAYAQRPLDGGNGGPRLFMNRQGVDDL
ncbi:Peptide-N4-(N-acetyl-beta-glucosaminyl)asparagine amidase A [Cytospora mali]|uniref:Peptide-N4-(N-acetyl-beta-glucosaminyl)asparagine amidase A n=1 Tax=Cytospora mali TaxID=578113 RepID=A0A194W946_CYTMA|nr:Peptide-N4-(N-acetyl-beta-glucosaminyl)asparagine amidase A [Valsa mali]